MKYLLQLFLLVIVFLFTGCNHTPPKEVVDLITQTREKYAPDSRIALYDIQINKNERFVVEGETNIPDAFYELGSVLTADYPKVKFNVSLLPLESMGDHIWGIITLSVASLRPVPSHRAELITQAFLGTPVKILKKEDNWYLVQTPDLYLGWITSGSIALFTEDEIYQYNDSERIIFTAMTGSCYRLPDEHSQVISDLVPGNILQVTGANPEFYKVQFPDGRTGYVNKNQCLPLDEWKESFTYHPEKILETAMKFLGLPYLWGGISSKAIDCSGFTKTVYFMNGIILQRDASQQVLYGELVNTSESYDNLEPADLLFFGTHETDSTEESITHVGLYIGDGEMIHASGRVKINSMIPGKENYSSYLDSIFIRARRVLTCVGEPGIEPVFESSFYR
jgi:SH3-like domain-containing protein